MSAVPGSEKVTRCTSKPWAFRRFSSTPSAPASAGVTDGQRMRACAMERASIMPSLNMHGGRRASDMRRKFELAGLVPAGRAEAATGAARPCLLLAEGVRTELVGRSAASQKAHFDKAPDAEDEKGETD